MKTVLLDKITLGEDIDLSPLKEMVDLVSYDASNSSEIVERCRDAEAILTNKVVISDEVIKSLPKLKYIGVLATGTNNIQITDDSITVKNAVGYSTDSVAQLTVTCLLNIWHRLDAVQRLVKSGTYSNGWSFTNLSLPFEELSGKKAGIIGMGNIGQKVAKLYTALGIDVRYTSLSGQNLQQPFAHLALDELLSSSDIISIHSPLNTASKKLMDEKNIGKMKSNGILINMGRGGIVNEEALCKALMNNQIRGACLDVYEKEPLPIDSPLINPQLADKLVLTPHIAWASVQARQKLIEITAENLKAFLSSRN